MTAQQSLPMDIPESPPWRCVICNRPLSRARAIPVGPICARRVKNAKLVQRLIQEVGR